MKWKIYQEYKHKEKVVPQALEMLVAGTLIFCFSYIFKISGLNALSLLIILGGFFLSLILSLSYSNAAFIFFYLFLVPLLVFRALIAVPGIVILLCAITFAFFWIFFASRPATVVTGYNIPEGVTPVEAAFLLSRDIGPQELVATIFTLMRRGFLSIESKGGKQMFYKTREYENDPTLLSYEKFLLNKIFVMPNVNIMIQTGIVYSYEHFPDRVDPELVFQNLGDWVQHFKGQLLDSLRYEKPILRKISYETKPVFLVLSGVYLLGGLMLTSTSAEGAITNSFLNGLFMIEPFLASLLFLAFAFIPILPLTNFGKEIYIKILGFKEFMKRVEKPRLQYIIRKEHMDIFELLNFLYALNLLHPFEWALECAKEDEQNEQALMFTQVLKIVHFQWVKGKNLWQEEIKY
ncbi:MAG TPA: DUF2207 domain-containing protein [Candidatus Hydrothermia bacterium]|nr:DUF2207 domain-containing protein [Candidatus Hydrothermae bacterium]HOP32563.1 DUF2207 domain-containing protein [Candidatus Hydrothermia bacterium]